MKTLLSIALLTLTVQTQAAGYKIYLQNGQSVMTITAEPAATGAVGSFEVARYKADGSSTLVSQGQIVKGSMDIPTAQPGEVSALPSYFEFSGSKNGSIKIEVLDGSSCKVSTAAVKGFSLKNRTVGCSIMANEDGAPGAFSGSN